MQQLPKGYYAVQSDFENSPKDTFTYKGVTYIVEAGVNLFATCAEANAAAIETPDEVLAGLPYEEFTAPVLLLSAGVHHIGGKREDMVVVGASRFLLGEQAGVEPNIFHTEDPTVVPTLNPARVGEGESELRGARWFSRMNITGDNEIATLVLDGFTCSKFFRVADLRAKSDYPCTLTFRNIIHTGPCGYPLYDAARLDADTALHRTVRLENIRLENFYDYGRGGMFAQLNAESITFSRVVINHTSQVFGFTDITRSISCYTKNAPVTRIDINGCYFKELGGENGISTSLVGNEDSALEMHVRDSVFVDASRVGEGFLTPHLANENCSLTVEGCLLVDTRGNRAAVSIWGEGDRVTLTDCRLEGFETAVEHAVMPPVDAPDKIENHADDWQTATADTHTVLGTDNADFTALEDYYAAYRPYYGDQHVHSDCGGTSDGKFPLADWPAAMDEKQLDFAAIVDHKQMRGFFLPEWDEERFIIGTEPGTTITDLENVIDRSMHYNMLFPHKYGLAMVMANFPEFEFRGDELTGSYKYPKFTKERFMELTRYIQSIGGIMVHPHPKTMMASDNPLDYYMGEHMYLEVMVGSYRHHSSIRSYDLWCDILALGKHVWASGGSDTHGGVSNGCVSTFYSKKKSGRAFFDVMHSADYAVGALGIQMMIDGHPMGSELVYRDGMRLTLRVGDFHAPAFRENTAYELRVYTDEGLAYASMFNGRETQHLSLAVQKRAFYRAEVVDLTHGGFRIAVGNPIWLDGKEAETEAENEA
ncbi:MAG: hypothetical protein E7644_07235 [Ruminococcaceae bacterium]|nr:hypothetical protein [Oscillospiraceae bacterium]